MKKNRVERFERLICVTNPTDVLHDASGIIVFLKEFVKIKFCTLEFERWSLEYGRTNAKVCVESD